MPGTVLRDVARPSGSSRRRHRLVCLAVLVVVLVPAWMLTVGGWRGRDGSWLVWSVLALAFVALVLVVDWRVTTTVTYEGVRIALSFWPVARIARSDIAGVSVVLVEVDAGHGGWALKGTRSDGVYGKDVLVTAGGTRAVRIATVPGRAYYVAADDPEAVAAAIGDMTTARPSV